MNGAGPQPGAVPEFAAVDAARFRETIRPTGRPAVMRGLAADWPLVAAGRHGGAGLREALGAAYSGAPIHAFRAEPAAGGRLHYTDRLDALNFRREQTRLDTLLDELVAQAGSPSADTLYAGSLPLPVIAPAIAAANRLDGFIHAETVLHSLWLGTKARVGVHYDQTENIAVVVAGR